MWNDRISMGIEMPAEEPKDIDAMRRAITIAARDSGLVNRCLASAEYQGLSGEDKHVMLAYYALRSLEDTHRRLMEFVMRTPSPFVIPAVNGPSCFMSAPAFQEIRCGRCKQIYRIAIAWDGYRKLTGCPWCPRPPSNGSASND